MLTLPIYLRGSSYYLHTRIGSKQFKKSLGTSDKKIAIVRALRLLESVSMAFEFDPSKIRTYRIDTRNGVFEADGEDDHRRLIEALGMISRPSLDQRIREFTEARAVKEVPQHKGLKLMELVDKFFLLKSQLKPATVLAYKTVAEEFSEFLVKPYIQTVIVSDVSRYQEHLSEQGNKPRTIDNKVGALRTLFNFAIKQGYYNEANPASNRALQSKKDKIRGGYEIFTDEEIQKIFNSDFMKKAEAEDPDYYWTLYLGLLTGCRISEITGIQKNQFKNTGGVNYIDIVDSKTIAGSRQISIPASIYESKVKAFVDGKTGQIFKYKLRLGKGSGNAVSKKFKRHLEAVGIKREKLVFHSFRKYSNDFFYRNSVPIEVRCQFFGHELDNVNVQIYTQKLTVQDMYKATAQVQVALLKQAGIYQEG